MGSAGDSTADTVRRLRAGGVLLLATDTVPGFHCRADQPDAVARLQQLKGRQSGKPLLVLAGSLDQAQSVLGDLQIEQLAACERCWPGPFSLILPAGDRVAAGVTGGSSSLAVRVPADRDLRELILAVGVPLVSTSANLAGLPPVVDMSAAAETFAALVDGVWSGAAAGEAGNHGPSALVDLTVTPFRVLRTGPQAFRRS